MSVFDHPSLGLAQGLKHILSRMLSDAGVIAPQKKRLLTIGNMKQAHDFVRVASQGLRSELNMPERTSEIFSDWETWRQKTSITRSENRHSLPIATKTLSALSELSNANQTWLPSPYVSIPQEEIYGSDPQLAEMIAQVVERAGQNDRIRNSVDYETLPKIAALQNYCGIGIGIGVELDNDKPCLRLLLFNNPKTTAMVGVMEELKDGIRRLFGDVLSVSLLWSRWNVASASINDATSPNVFSKNYFTREHGTLRPGLSIKSSTGVEGSMLGVFTGRELNTLWGCECESPSVADQRFLLTCKHVAYASSTENGRPKISRKWNTGADREVADVLQPEANVSWWIDFAREPYDLAFCAVENGSESSSTVVGAAGQTFEMRLGSQNELASLLEKGTDVVLLGKSGPVGAAVRDIDVDAPYIYKSEGVAAFLDATGLRLARSMDRRAGAAGNSGGPVIIDRNENKDGQSDNLIIGIRVAGDPGKTFADRDDRQAPMALYQSLAVCAEAFNQTFDDLGASPEVHDDTLVEKSLSDDKSHSDLSTVEAPVDKNVNFSVPSYFQRYLSGVSSEEENISKAMISSLKKEVRRHGGLITSTVVKKTDDGSGFVVELHLANNDVSDELHELEEKYATDPKLEFVAGRRFFVGRSN